MNFNRPFETWSIRALLPTLKRWAIFVRSLRDGTPAAEQLSAADKNFDENYGQQENERDDGVSSAHVSAGSPKAVMRSQSIPKAKAHRHGRDPQEHQDPVRCSVTHQIASIRRVHEGNDAQIDSVYHQTQTGEELENVER